MVPSVTDVVKLVRSARSRPFTCRGCGAPSSLLVTASASGRLPVRCEACEPNSSTWRRERAERPLRAAIVALDDRVRELEGLLEATAGTGSAARARRLGPPGRESVQRAIRLVAYAKGAGPTSDALLDLAAVATAWATHLSGRGPEPTS